MMAAAVENWDDDVDFHGDFHTFAGQSSGTAHTNVSSRMSVQSESIAGDDEWNLVFQPDDRHSTTQALQSARQAGIPLPDNVPTSALLGGTIKRLGKKQSKVKVDDDWDNDLDMPDGAPLKLQLKPATSSALDDSIDDFDDLEGSLGIRFGGTRRDTRGRSSSASLMSPSMGSQTAESEEDELRGLELPEEPMDFDAMLKKRRVAEAELSDISQTSPAMDQHETGNTHKKSKLQLEDSDDFADDFDFGTGDILNNPRRAINKNLKLRSAKPATQSPRAANTINFHDKPTDKPIHVRSHLPRPISAAKQGSRLEPVFESGALPSVRERRYAAPTTTSSQLLRAKRSMPVLSSRQHSAHASKPSITSLLPGTPSFSSPAGTVSRVVPYHLRRDSDPNNRRGAASPPPRPNSRLSNAYTPDTPSRPPPRQRLDLATAALAREAAAKKTITKPTRRRNFGDGSELDIFDDLPTSTAKESKYVKQPIARGPPKLGLRQTQSRTDMRDPPRRNFAIPERMMTPAPSRGQPSPVKNLYETSSSTPSYLRDTAASRIARETRLNHPRPRSEGPLMPMTTNWKAQIAARSPQGSPSAQRHRSKKSAPTLIKNIGLSIPKSEKGMVYNPQTMRWEGNENMLMQFDLPPLETPTPTSSRPYASFMDPPHGLSSSPPRPALIAPAMGLATQGVQVNSGMVFDPQQMKWLKLKDGRDVSGPLSPSATDCDDDDPLACIPDLVEEQSPAVPPSSVLNTGIGSPVSMVGSTTVPDVHEEFDLGPVFINRQREEETLWRRRCEHWFPNLEPRYSSERWRWAIREILPQDEVGFL